MLQSMEFVGGIVLILLLIAGAIWAGSDRSGGNGRHEDWGRWHGGGSNTYSDSL